MLKLAPILKEISKDFRMGGHDGSGGHDGKLHQAFTLVMEWEAVEYLKVSRWDQKSQITTVEYGTICRYGSFAISLFLSGNTKPRCKRVAGYNARNPRA